MRTRVPENATAARAMAGHTVVLMLAIALAMTAGPVRADAPANAPAAPTATKAVTPGSKTVTHARPVVAKTTGAGKTAVAKTAVKPAPMTVKTAVTPAPTASRTAVASKPASKPAANAMVMPKDAPKPGAAVASVKHAAVSPVSKPVAAASTASKTTVPPATHTAGLAATKPMNVRVAPAPKPVSVVAVRPAVISGATSTSQKPGAVMKSVAPIAVSHLTAPGKPAAVPLAKTTAVPVTKTAPSNVVPSTPGRPTTRAVALKTGAVTGAAVTGAAVVAASHVSHVGVTPNVAPPAPHAVRGVGNTHATNVPTTAQLDEHVTYQYNTLGRRDPFQSFIDGSFVGEDVGGDAPLDVGGMKVVGIVWGDDDKFAMVEDGRGNSHVLRRGDKVMNGVVEDLKQDGVVVNLTADGQSQSVTIPLIRKGDKNASR